MEIKKTLIISLFVYLVISLSFLIFLPHGIQDLRNKQELYNIKKPYFDEIPEGSIVFTKCPEIFFYPKSIPAYYSSFPKEMRLNKTTVLVIDLLKNEINEVFFVLDDYWNKDPKESYFLSFEENGLAIEPFNKNIYRIIKK